MNNGIYGDSPEDRYYSRMLEKYLAEEDEPETETVFKCPYCGDESYKNTQCCNEMHREEIEVMVERDEDDYDEPDDEEDTGY